ncbi:hypothetical protein [Acinetobacter gyllenbergii]|uniref:hypothetical protein n=1 Tax=Acinetobacter gyllenbergii TaxID=134534 RepID=UPI000806BC22|nr:hypothetical protein [Acinetobacter gyllenbergii]OBY73290.1 hypothetical protein NG55_15865 [Acinetobacter gyllenbergii]
MKKMLSMIVSIFLISFLVVGCIGYGDHKTNALLKKQIGHPLNGLVAQIGAPHESVEDVLSKEKTYMHTWTIQKYARDKFVKTGSEYAGTKVTTLYSAGQGVVAAQPIYEDQYRDVGYNSPTYYTCLLRVFTDANGIIIAKGGVGLKTESMGTFCDEFLNLK